MPFLGLFCIVPLEEHKKIRILRIPEASPMKMPKDEHRSGETRLWIFEIRNHPKKWKFNWLEYLFHFLELFDILIKICFIRQNILDLNKMKIKP